MRSKLVMFLALPLMVLFATLVRGQGTNGEISGMVKDPQGASVPGATVTVTNLETPFKREVTTNSDGYYRFVGLPVGRYEVRAEHQGFKTGVINLKLTVAEAAVANFDMEVGAITEQVTVTLATGGEVETTQSTMNGLVDENASIFWDMSGNTILEPHMSELKWAVTNLVIATRMKRSS